MKAFKGQVVKMLRHPCGSRVINELYTAASTKQRRALCAEFYGREAVLFHEAGSPSQNDIRPWLRRCLLPCIHYPSGLWASTPPLWHAYIPPGSA